MHAGIQLHPSGHRVAHTGLGIFFFFFCGPELALKTKWTTILFDDENLQTTAQCGVVRMTDV